MIWFIVFLISPFLPIIFMSIIWYFWSKDKVRVEKLYRKQKTIETKLKRLIFKEEAPFGELRYPIMLLTVSTIVFSLLLVAFGFGINTSTGEMTVDINWSRYIDEDTGIYDPWLYSPLDNYIQKNPEVIFLTIYGGYCAILCVIIIVWFEYIKWKWEHIPVKYKLRTVIKTEKKKMRFDG